MILDGTGFLDFSQHPGSPGQSESIRTFQENSSFRPDLKLLGGWRNWEPPQIPRMKLAQKKGGLKDGEKQNSDDVRINLIINLVMIMVIVISISQMRKPRLGEVRLVVPNSTAHQ